MPRTAVLRATSSARHSLRRPNASSYPRWYAAIARKPTITRPRASPTMSPAANVITPGPKATGVPVAPRVSERTPLPPPAAGDGAAEAGVQGVAEPVADEVGA